jgi:DNA-binding FadR family transcriptional regulator
VRAEERAELRLARVRIPKSAEVIASQLRRRIADGRLRPGESLPPETQLAEDFGVSRPTLREALRVLEAQGLLGTQRGSRSGIRAKAPTTAALAVAAGVVLEYRGATVADVFEAQEIIEPACAGRLASGATPVVLGQLWDAVRRDDGAPESDQSDQPDESDESDESDEPDLHELIVELSGNETVRVMQAVVRPILRATRWSCLSRERTTDLQRDRWRDAHRTLVEYINAHDVGAAEALWRAHLAEMNSIFVSGPSTVLDLLDPPIT